MKKLSLLFLAMTLAFSGCATKTGTGAAIGSAGGAIIGAAAGQALGRNTESTVGGALAGAAAGGAIGAGVGHMMDKQEQEYRQALASSEAAAVRREGNLLAIVLKGDVSFDTNSAEIRPGLYSEIDRIANIMAQYPQTSVIVEGHTDSRGKDAYNMELSRKRADAVRELLVRRGVNSALIQTAAYGETMPVADNNTAEGRQKNRRVEIKIQPTSAG